MIIKMFGHKRVPSREGGVEVVVGELSSRMAAQGHQVICYNRAGFQSSPKDKVEGVTCKTVLTLNKKGLAAVTSSISAAICCAFGKADVVHIHAEGPAFMSWLPKLFGKRVIVTVHGLDWQREKWKNGFASKYIRAGEKMAVRYADEIIVLSRNVQAYFQKQYSRKTVWIPNGVDKPRRVPAEQIRDSYGLQKDGYILYLGRLVPEKGAHYLIEAYRDIETDKKLVIAGGASDTAEYAESLRELAKGDDRIVFTGFVQGRLLQELYSNAWIFVQPSDLEGMPLTLLEAMSYGNCCLTSDIPECTEVAEDHALTFLKGNVDDLREKLNTLCTDPRPVAAMKADASVFICQKYDWDRVVEKTMALYGVKTDDPCSAVCE